MNTNFNKTKEEIIFELLLSLNNGNTGYADNRIELAITQYNKLIEHGIINERCNHNWVYIKKYYSDERMCNIREYKCNCCGEIKQEYFTDEGNRSNDYSIKIY